MSHITLLKEELEHAKSMYVRAIHNNWGDQALVYWEEMVALVELLNKEGVCITLERREDEDNPFRPILSELIETFNKLAEYNGDVSTEELELFMSIGISIVGLAYATQKGFKREV